MRNGPDNGSQICTKRGNAEDHVGVGAALPFGAHLHGDGANFAVFTRHATQVWLEFYVGAEDETPVRIVELDPSRHRTGDVWHVWVQDVRPGQLYAYRMDGPPYLPEQGHRFNRHKMLLDPYAKAITGRKQWDFGAALGYNWGSPQGDLSFSRADDAGAMPKCIVTDNQFDWEGDQPLRIPWSETIIYETHLRGFTFHPSSGAAHPGTYRGWVEKLPYLKELGITAMELMPVHEFNENEVERVNPLTGERLKNYWGYNTVGFFAPKASYCSSGGMGQQTTEFKDMVKACHCAGIEIILDVVFNHTAEGSELGPTLSFRGIDNAIYYMLDENKRCYKDYTGTGNTVNANHPVLRDFILDALRYWVSEMHVDGFRFDLASVLDRGEAGNLLADAPLLERIAEDPILRETKIIAEAWDAAGAYQVGSFSERRWAEWNGRYRDDIRRFWRGDGGLMGVFASRICGSADIYQGSGKGPESSINFVACHDGFTLNDVVSYAHKHNLANGEENRDGTDENYGANYGVEGETNDPEIQAVRVRQIKNFLLALFISRGVPMLLGGDEFRRTQQGNNNAYCQDNEISWHDWRLLDRHREIFRFVRGMIAFRRVHPVLSREAFYTGADILFFSPAGRPPDWFDHREKCLSCLIPEEAESNLYVMFNASPETVPFVLPVPSYSGRWRLVADTSRPWPGDLYESGAEPVLEEQQTYRSAAHSSTILIASRQ